MLQVPSNDGITTCSSRGAGCVNACSSHGVCMQASKNNSQLKCFCDGGYYGNDCSIQADDAITQTCSNDVFTMALSDAWGDGWEDGLYAIMDSSTGVVISNAFDTLYYYHSTIRYHCLPDGEYRIVVEAGSYAHETAWALDEASLFGSAPTTRLSLFPTVKLSLLAKMGLYVV